MRHSCRIHLLGCPSKTPDHQDCYRQMPHRNRKANSAGQGFARHKWSALDYVPFPIAHAPRLSTVQTPPFSTMAGGMSCEYWPGGDMISRTTSQNWRISGRCPKEGASGGRV